MKTLRELVINSVGKYGERHFISDKGLYFTKRYSYQEVYENALRICRFFKEKKIKKGDKVALFLPNSSDYVSLVFACALSGAVAVPIDFNSNGEFAKKIYKLTGSKIIFCSLFKQVDSKNLFFIEEIEKIYEDHKPLKPIENIMPQDIFEIVYTSGTTSEPKGVVLTHENLTSNVLSMVDSITFNTKNLSFLSILPLSHLFEQNLGLFSPILLGGG